MISFLAWSRKMASGDQPILDPGLLLPAYTSQPLPAFESPAGAASLPSSSDNALSSGRSLPSEASEGLGSSSPGADPVAVKPSLSHTGPAGSWQGLPRKADMKPKRRLKRSRSSPAPATQQLQQSQHDTGEEQGLKKCMQSIWPFLNHVETWVQAKRIFDRARAQTIHDQPKRFADLAPAAWARLSE